MTTPLFILRCLQAGISIQYMELLTIGMANDIAVEANNDTCEYATLATQDDFDRF